MHLHPPCWKDRDRVTMDEALWRVADDLLLGCPMRGPATHRDGRSCREHATSTWSLVVTPDARARES